MLDAQEEIERKSEKQVEKLMIKRMKCTVQSGSEKYKAGVADPDDEKILRRRSVRD